ncbi:energy transducer TonB [Sporomusa acidovorans]|uniref:TonB C-terminal domain-containing protein n=1 Tax=Sporomusa acidovorans (strain ATCC 49682 / DSM 3132 / Mol) TaxID=1123286 RepID=A0ABZ3IYT8_SPOA4|nr:energy transducer TonB [Sporomusa acidovorans]OZC22207.1 transport protein TonB [Sporomusa acidovorans DSM 3132]SDE81589.1 protein TonB [Sporomusa acidovorans]
MLEQSYGRRAVVFSCCFHCLLFIGAGWLGGGLFSQAAEPETIEMELVSSSALPAQAAPVPITMPQAASSVIQPGVANSLRPMTASAAASDGIAERVSPAAAVSAGGNGLADAAVPAVAAGNAAGGEAAAASLTAAPPQPRKIAAPRVLNRVDPDYPDDARQEGFAGTVKVKVEVLENGRPGEVFVVRSSGRQSIDEAALRAVRRWRFVPAQEVGSGEAVRCYTTFSVVFELN